MSRILKIAIPALCAVSLFFSIYTFIQQRSIKTGYVDNVKLFNEFKMKKEIEVKLNTRDDFQKNVMDSLLAIIKVLERKKANSGLSAKELDLLDYQKNRYLGQREEFEKSSATLVQQYDNQIWTRLNQYIKEFGAQNNYHLILGTKGDGNVMYADTNRDLTEEVLKYANQKYTGN